METGRYASWERGTYAWERIVWVARNLGYETPDTKPPFYIDHGSDWEAWQGEAVAAEAWLNGNVIVPGFKWGWDEEDGDGWGLWPEALAVGSEGIEIPT